MIITAFFTVWVLGFTLFLKRPKEWRRQNDIWDLTGWFCLFWIPAIMFGTYWGFVDYPPPRQRFFTIVGNDGLAMFLCCAVMLSVPLSYAAAFKLGSQKGYREGWSNAVLTQPPQLLSEAHDGKPTEIGGYDREDSSITTGHELSYNGRVYVVTATEIRQGLLYYVAQHKDSQHHEDQNSDRA